MTPRLFAGSFLSMLYTTMVGPLPFSVPRNAFLRAYLGAFGPGSSVQTGCRFLNGRRVHLGARNVINYGCVFDGRHYDIRIGDDVSIGPEASILTLGHDPRSPTFALQGGTVTIGRFAWIGYRAIVLPGVAIGEGAAVGAAAVVTKDVEPFAIVAGNPARKVGERPRDLSYRLQYEPLFL